MKYLITLFCVLAFICVNVFAADTTNTAVNFSEDNFGVLYYGPATMASVGNTL